MMVLERDLLVVRKLLLGLKWDLLGLKLVDLRVGWDLLRLEMVEGWHLWMRRN